jgi:phosphoserine phosphatase RsbU/P
MQRFYQGSLALRVLLVTIVVFALPLLIYFLVIFNQGTDERLTATLERLSDLGRSRALVLSELNKYSFQTINIVDELMNIQGQDVQLSSSEISSILTDVVHGGDFDSAVYVSINEMGRYVSTAASDPSMIGQNYSEYPYIQDVMRDGQTSFLSYGTTSFERYFYVAKVVYSKTTYLPQAIIILATTVNDLIARVLATDETTYSVNFSLLTADHIVFASGNPELTLLMLKPLSEQRLQQLQNAKWFGTAPLRRSDIIIKPIPNMEGAYKLTWKGKTSIAIEVPVKDTDYTLLLDADQSQIFGDIYQHLLHVMFIFFVIFLIGGWAALWITQRMSEPLRKLCDVMNRVSHGDLTARFGEDKMGFEINVIGEIFNNMIDSLQSQMAAAEQERVQKETLKKELSIGQQIQMSILPHERPEFQGLEIAARYMPAKEVGGDFYDIFVRKRETNQPPDLVLTIADASGKGISACLYSLCVRSMLRSYCVDHEDVSSIMTYTNNLFLEDTGMTGMFVTAFTAIYHPDTHILDYASSGHNPAFLFRADKTVEELSVPGIALGVVPVTRAASASIQLQSGDLLLFYTDGITESHNPRNQMFGKERMVDYVGNQRTESIEKIIDGLLLYINEFAQGIPQFDDITILVVRVL